MHTGTINLLQEHASMALFCCRYLSSPPFLISEECLDIYSAIQTGYFGFMDYAAVHFASHFQAIQSSHGKLHSASESKIAVDAAMRDLVRPHGGEDKDASIESPCTDYPLEISGQTLGLSIQKGVAVIRETMHARQSDLSLDAQFTNLEGPIRFKCPRIQCSKFAIGFMEQDAYEKHLHAHERPFRCNRPDCFVYVTGYPSQQQLRDHSEDVHSESSQPKFSFPNVNGTGGWDIVEACKAGNLDEVKRFHLAGSDLSKTIPKKSMPLSAAVIAGRFQICEYLVNNGVNPYTKAPKAPDFSSPAYLSVRHRRFQIMEFFLRKYYHATHLPVLIALAISADFPRGLDLLMTFIQPEEHFKIISNVFSSLMDFTSSRSRVIGQAQRKYLFDATTLHVWLERMIPKLYHSSDAPTDTCGKGLCRDSREYQTAKEAILNDEFFRRSLFEGSCHPLKRFLLDFVSKDDLQVKYYSGNTPLHLVLRGARGEGFYTNKQCHICVALVQRIVRIDDGSSANTSNKNGELPAHTAMDKGVAPEALETLLPFTKDLNKKDNNGLSLLHQATVTPDHLRVLLKHDGVDLFIRNRKGQTAFSYAVESYDSVTVGILECLVQADKRLVLTADENSDGQTPLHYAMEKLDLASGDSERKSRIAIATFLLRQPGVEDILRAYLACPSLNYPQKVRQYAQDEGLTETLEVMDRIGF
jgi:ankyrin repeat protein